MARESDEERSEKRRSYPRIRLHEPAPIRLPNGLLMPDTIYDVSYGGLQLRCDRESAIAIHPAQSVISETNCPRTVLTISFPYPRGLGDIVIDCSLRYLRVLDQGNFAFGVKFEAFQGDGVANFDRFIAESLIPKMP